MGIPQLRRHLEPYAERAILDPSNVVLDGPALAYHVLGLCTRTARKTSPLEQPSYELLGRTAIAWLKRIQSCGLLVSAIYFDSFLPASKRPERIQRLIKSSRDLIKYHSAYPAGVPGTSSRHAAGDADVDLFPSAWPAERKAQPPAPPFLVPAIIDALRSSPEFGHLVKLVPGEADGFCARHVRQHGGLVLTSDSDLLVYDLGQTGGVVFLADIAADEETQRLWAPQYIPVHICKRLSLKPEAGLRSLAFEVSRDPHLTLQQAVERCKAGQATSATEDEYSDFVDLYLSPEVASKLEADHVLLLDPRISEIVLRSLKTKGIATTSPGNKTISKRDDDDALEMFLPFLLDCPARTSAWEASKATRQLAYAVLQSLRGSDVISMSEMRRLQSMSSGTNLAVPKLTEIDGLGDALLARLYEIEAGLSDPNLIWVTLAIYEDIAMTIDRGRGSPLSLGVLRQAASGEIDPCSWEFLHLLAQTQATYYSLRMLFQVLKFAAHHTGTLSTPLSKLVRYLARLPSLPDFPSARTFAQTLLELREGGALSSLQTLCADYGDAMLLIRSVQEPQNDNKSKKRKRRAPPGGTTKPRSGNPFDLLAGVGD
ncbi:hypothetical protein MYCTH_2299128 [Thermothelomyces thermophilus ATCC 42464]|uniref:Asteroid domain-containing protein n=1 Tax=Thermothelomyces thermophilus (strain ATCC 42464 / BCRC 31852 / DSM 1799) TaxID=573729 RepID=G2Q4T3_THET4|nr:uncharacterized protein MYCTH_2299128 [Thermothelomyces thermophilus ATCC 42464]AEO55372.1 hypothetical protein MYCTH_2299128 [Thermothelomyces thermophilus ATCC 42464]